MTITLHISGITRVQSRKAQWTKKSVLTALSQEGWEPDQEFRDKFPLATMLWGYKKSFPSLEAAIIGRRELAERLHRIDRHLEFRLDRITRTNATP
jgi:hypothetical protein